MSLDERTLTIKDVKDAATEKLEFYRQWLERKIITQKEYDDAVRILNSVEGLLIFKSKVSRTTQEAV